MADIQLLTGICVLITGFIALPCGIDAFHWRILVYLAWFSSITHLSGLVATSHIYERVWEKHIRIFLSLLFLVMLMVATVPVGFFDWGDPLIRWRDDIPTVYPGSPAVCSFNFELSNALNERVWEEICSQSECWSNKTAWWWPPEAKDERPSYHIRYSIGETATFQGMVISLIFLALGFIFRILKLVPSLSGALTRRVREPIATFCERFITKLATYAARPHESKWASLRQDFWTHLVVRPVIACFLVFQIHIDLFTSIIAELSWLFGLLLWGTIRVMGARMSSQQESVVQDANEWSFGQTLPVLLLLGPIVMVVRSFATHISQGVQRRDTLAWPLPPTRISSITLAHYNLESHSSVWACEGDRISTAQTSGWRIRARTQTTQLGSPEVDRSIFHLAKFDYYSDSSWMGSCVTMAYASFWLLAGTFLETIIDNNTERAVHMPERPVANFWFQDNKPLAYLLVYHPIMCHLNILVGVYSDDITLKPGWNWARNTILRFIHLSVLGVYISLTLYWPMYTNTPRIYQIFAGAETRTHPVGAILTAAMYLLYGIVVGVLAFKNNRKA
ncbi:hypothetical protein CEP54_002669 [Fusarium duplospermum]|uniref:Uncharacterized protein n=1 Tax=Fusarium duplospermum TaxID=1325734 RepID=A0A428QTJ1_9HYPO|nr:hypothetical protein CEP54_002669 [Fusarium duplospermum]